MPALLLEKITPDNREIEQAQKAVSALSEGNLEVSQLPEVARRLLFSILTELADGNALSIIPLETDVTTSRAASFLNVSRPYLSRLLDEGKLPFHRVGTHKRVRLRDLQEYRDRQDRDSEAALAALQAQAQELNMGY